MALLLIQVTRIPGHALAAMAVHRARQGNIRQHKIWMVLLYILALLVTGVFTLLPGRVTHSVLLGV